jgi:hypothetical protein
MRLIFGAICLWVGGFFGGFYVALRLWGKP